MFLLLKRVLLLGGMVLAASGCDNNFRADPPVDPDDIERYGFGSILENKELVDKIFSKKNSNELDVKSDKSSKTSTNNNVIDNKKLWAAVRLVLKNNEFELLDKQKGEIITEPAAINDFDPSGNTKYVIKIRIRNAQTTVKNSLDISINSTDKTLTNSEVNEEILCKKIEKTYIELK